MRYFIADIAKIFRARATVILLAAMAGVMLLDPLTLVLQSWRMPNFFVGIGDNPYQYWLLTNNAGWGNALYFTLFWAFPVLFTGLVLYSERASSCYILLVVRGGRAGYFLAKVASASLVAFASVFVLLSANIMVTYLVFHGANTEPEQYSCFVPQEGSFAHGVFQYSPLAAAFCYALLNAAAISVFTAVATGIHMLFRFKNRYIALVAPVLLFYFVGFVFDTASVSAYRYNIGIIVQPLAATSALETEIAAADVWAVYAGWIAVSAAVFAAGLARNRESL